MSTNLNKLNNHSFFMDLALKQAHRNIGNTYKNPSVGCVITKDNKLISAASTSLNGRPHAEHNAINFCKTNFDRSNIYITLEPCSHRGKTSACVNKIIKNKFKKVFFSVKDPDLRSYNKSIIRLRKNNIAVNTGISYQKISDFYRSYFISKNDELPFVTCKVAASKDFYTINKRSKWITNFYSRGRVHLLRSYHDCIMTSSHTIIKDNSLLTCRIHGLYDRSPSRIILDNKLKIPIKSRVIKDNFKKGTIIFYNKSDKKKIKLLKSYGINLFKIPLDENGNLDLIKALYKTKRLGFSRIFLESGIKLTTSFFKKNLIHDFKLFISDTNLNNNGSGNIKYYYKTFLRNKKANIEKINLFGDKFISYRIK
tara:strand:+ start:1663 stop:2766 length:1104 start_codon:yes stop_codon:yes gene_type:complete